MEAKFQRLTMQLLTKIGILNVPDWFDAGKVSIQNSFAPFSKFILASRSQRAACPACMELLHPSSPCSTATLSNWIICCSHCMAY